MIFEQSNSFHFPIIKCKVHQEPSGFVCINPDTKQNIFLCSRCMLNEYRNYDKQDTCVVLNDFAETLKSFANSNLSENVIQDEFIQPIINAQQLFLQHIEHLRSELSSFMVEIQNSFYLSCQTMQTNFELIINDELTKFNSLCNKLIKLNSATNHNSFPNFQEIEQSLASFTDQNQIEEYVRDLLRKKLQVEKIGSSLNNLSQIQNAHFTNELNKIINNYPKIVNQEEILAVWKKILDKGSKNLIKLGSQKIFTNLSVIDPYPLNIQKPDDLFLLTKEQLEFYCQINFQFEDEWPQNDILICISRLDNLQELVQNVSLKIKNWPNDDAIQFISSLKMTSKKIRSFEFEMVDEHASKSVLNSLSGLIGGFTQNEILKISFEDCQLSASGIKLIGNLIETQKENLKHLELNLRHNSVNGLGLNSLSQAIHECNHLKVLKFNINGYSVKQNSIELHQWKIFFEYLKDIGNIEELYLGLGDCLLEQKATIYLSRLLAHTPSIQQLSIDLYNTRQNEQSLKKLIEGLQSLPNLDSLKINLNNNPQIGNEGYNELLKFQQNNQGKYYVMDLKFKNIGADKEPNTFFKANQIKSL